MHRHSPRYGSFIFGLFGWLLSLILEANTRASYEGLNYVGAIAGPGGSSRNSQTRGSLGIEVGEQMSATFGIGGRVIRLWPLSATSEKDSEFYAVTGSASYFAKTLLQGLRFDFSAGFAYSSDSTLAPLLGTCVGFDHALGDGYSFGGEASTLTRIANPWEQSIQLLFVARYWF